MTAQEALNKIVEHSCPKRTNCKSCEIANRCNAWMKNEVDKIQYSIDCHLTVEEIDVLMVCMSYYAMRHPGKTTINGIDVDFMSELFNKLDKQKKMWENKFTFKVIKDYIKQLEKENKDLRKQAFNNDSLRIRICELERCIERLQGNKKNREVRIRNIEKENIELTKQLQAKDKALDKACKELARNIYSCPYNEYNVEPRGDCAKRCQDNLEGECWKKWCENEID